MIVVVDASILVVALASSGTEQRAVQRWLVDLTGGDRIYILQNFTQLQFISAIRRLSLAGRISDVRR